MPEEKNNTTLFYGWFTMGACFAVLLTQGGTMWTFGVFLKPMTQDLRWSRAQVSSGYTAFLLGYVISVITTGRLADKYSPRPILLVSAILTGLGFSLCSQVHTVNHLRMLLFIGGLGGGCKLVGAHRNRTALVLCQEPSGIGAWNYHLRRRRRCLDLCVTG